MRKIPPTKAIRLHCIGCSGGNMAEVKRCEMDDCPLYNYRMGKNPRTKKANGNPRALDRYRKNPLLVRGVHVKKRVLAD